MAEEQTHPALAEVLLQGRRIACGEGSRTLEAEHLLLALAGSPGSRPGQVLDEAGLNADRVRELLRRERQASLAYAGVESSDVPPPALEPGFTPRWGTSAKEAVVRGKAASAGRRGTASDLLVGLLRAEAGTVPRALALAGIDREAIIGRLAGPEP
jgi:ATP-dependent Clp protease ATP-binding subunit ClpA